MGSGFSPTPRRWVMVGCLQGKTGAGCRSKVNKFLIAYLRRLLR